MEQQYIVTLVSELDASKRDAVAADVEARLGMPRAKVIKLLEQGTGPLTKPVTKAVADRVAGAMQAAGIAAESVPHDWQSVLLLDPPEQADAETANDALLFDNSPLEPQTVTEPEATLSGDAEPSIDPQVDAMGDDLGVTEPSPSVSYTALEPSSGSETDGAADQAAVTATESEPFAAQETPLAPPASGSPWRWLAPLLLLLIGLGLAYLFWPTQNTAAASNAEAATETEAQASAPEAADPIEPLDDAPPLNESAASETSPDTLEVDEPPPQAEVLAEESAEEPVDEPAEDAAAALEDDADLVDVSSLASETAPADSVEAGESNSEENTEIATSDSSDTPELLGDALIEGLSSDAEEGKFEAQLELARRYAAGEGVEQDYAQSAVWYERAAAAGDQNAQYEIGWHYANGLGVERDLDAATSWYEAAALSGNAEAQYQLGFYRYYGQGGDQDLDEAKSLFLAAAEQGVAEARFRLGVMLLEGEGGPVDEAEAERWLRLAADQGVQEAEPYLEQLASDVPGDTSVTPEESEESTLNDVDPAEAPEANTAVVPLGAEGSASDASSNLQAAALSAQDRAFFDLVKSEEAAAIAEAIRAGANVNARDPYGQTPLMYAASFNSPNAIAELVVDLAEINAQSNAGWTALMYAARDNPNVVATLLDRGADAGLTNNEGQTALAIAQASGSVATQLLADATERGSN